MKELTTVEDWTRAIKRECKTNGTYQKTDDNIIRILAEIMVKRTLAEREFLQAGGHTVITHTNKAGATNVCRNPILTTWMDLTTAALPYWRELGLSPSARKRITGESTPKTSANALVKALKEL